METWYQIVEEPCGMPDFLMDEIEADVHGSRRTDIIPAEPDRLFKKRADRLRTLAADHPLAPYLNFLADIATSQDKVVANLPLPPLADIADADLAPLARDRSALTTELYAALDAFFAALAEYAMPEQSRAALEKLTSLEQAQLGEIVLACFDDRLEAEHLALQGFVAAGLQIYFTRLAAQLPLSTLKQQADDQCPACGGPPASSVLVSANAPKRYVICACCATGWNVLRIKCIQCGSLEKIHYSHISSEKAEIEAECCDNCKSYLKIFNAEKNPKIEFLADDVASSGLDLLLRDEGYWRFGVNPFLAGL